ncbi:VOC family protein [Flavobacterium caeni]|uniref:Glyoxalase superfamily enzyme, possibly 3-demethylubiquinone-9 3-methyltransferase n=1 Tax=Flavobacterium caeni TaxID=490189 RepID=A0A1G5HTZ5_9FLAO|nr:VOC family protein [Flavobacterium caeni]SCY67194.1 Glyoxalase superfamily enzyme, possibly 3-demethylubiquinone-9 3-methyltransferase [Flavobacterium caeni]
MDTQKIAPFLWFENQAEQAVNFYVSLFKDAKITDTTRYGKGAPGPEGEVMVMGFELFGQEFVALNGNTQCKFNDSVSFYVKCHTQQEIDQYWDGILAAGGQTLACGWIRDQYGVAWQITPPMLPEMLQDKDPEKAARVMQAMMQMIKIDIQKIQDAYDGK